MCVCARAAGSLPDGQPLGVPAPQLTREQLLAKQPGADGARARKTDAAAQKLPCDEVRPHLEQLLYDIILNKTANNLGLKPVEAFLDSVAANELVRHACIDSSSI